MFHTDKMSRNIADFEDMRKSLNIGIKPSYSLVLATLDHFWDNPILRDRVQIIANSKSVKLAY